MKKLVSIFLVLAMAVLTGCGEKKPAGFPEVHPVTLTVTDGSEKLPNIRVMFYPDSGNTGYGITGTTDASGTAILHTMQAAHAAKGAPAGSYTVTLEDVIEVPGDKTPAEIVKMSLPEQKAYHEEQVKKRAAIPKKIPEALNKKVTSKVKQTISAGENNITIDVSQYKGGAKK